MKTSIAIGCTIVFALSIHAATYYVDAIRSDDTGNGQSWANAKKTIQAAVDVATEGDTVLVTNGVYNTGTRVTPGFSLNNRVVIVKDITVKSVNGAAVTSIEGSGVGNFGNLSAVRCVFMSSGVLEGFALKKGSTLQPYPDNHPDIGGGGVYLSGGVVKSCILTNNKGYNGGGSEGGTFHNCLFYGNSAMYGGGSYYSTLINCTITANDAYQHGGGSYGGQIQNSISCANTCTLGGTPNYHSSINSFLSSCTTPLPLGTGNISADPLFVNAGLSDYRLQNNSPCLNVGSNAFVQSETDLDGKPRILNGTVDMGAYELPATSYALTYDFEETPLSTVWASSGSGSPWIAETRVGNAHSGSRALALGSVGGNYDVVDVNSIFLRPLTRGYISWWFYDENAGSTEYYLRTFLIGSNNTRIVGISLLDLGYGAPESTTYQVDVGNKSVNHGVRSVGWHNAKAIVTDTGVFLYIDDVFALSNVMFSAVKAIEFEYHGFYTGTHAALYDDLTIQYEDGGGCTVTFDPEGGTVNPNNKIVTVGGTYGDMPEPTKVGYSFGGWWSSLEDSKMRVTSDTTVTVTNDHTLVASWTANRYTVTFVAQGGAVDPANKVVTFGAAYGTLPIAMMAGYVFGGWQTGVGEEVSDLTVVTVAADHTLYARWLQLPPLFTKQVPVANPAPVNEGASVAFSVSANDSTDGDATRRGMSNIVWYVEGVRKQETRTGAPNAITSGFTFKPGSTTVQGMAFRDVEVRAVATDRQGGTTETIWSVRVNNVPANQTITFPAFPVFELGVDFVVFPAATTVPGVTVNYSSSNDSVAKFDDGLRLLRIIGAGTAVITASQSGNFDYKAAAPVQQTLTVKARLTADVPAGGGMVSGSGLYLPGTKVALTARPSTGFTFLQWEEGSQTTARSLVMPNASTAVSAFFGITTNVAPPAVGDPGPQRAMVGVPFTVPLDIQSDSLPMVTVAGLPIGLKYSSTAKSITGVPTVSVSNRTVTVTAKNVNKTATTQTFTMTVDPLPAWAQGNFNGWFGGATGVGPISGDVTAQGKVSGKLSSLGTNYTFSAASYARRDGDGAFWVTATASVAKVTMPLTLAVRNPAGVMPPNLSVVDGWFAVSAEGERDAALWRNVWKDAGMAAVATNYTGYYTATLPGEIGFGSGYLLLTVDKSGGVKTTGKLADSTAVSLSGMLILDETGRVFAVLYTAPAAYKGGGFFGVAEFFKTGVGAKVIVRLLDGEPMVWESLNPTATQVYGAGFSRYLGLSGGWYDTLGNLYAYYSNRAMTVGTEGAPVPEIMIGTNRYDSVCWDPDGLALTVVTNKLGVMTGLSTPKAGTPVKAGVAYDYTNPTNTVGLTITLTRATGVFKGSFKAWFDYVATHTSKTITYEGVLTPEREDKDDGIAGRGFFLWSDKSQYLNPQNKVVPYSFNWSYNLSLLLSE